MIYHRITIDNDILTKDDYIRGFGINNHHYSNVRKAREKFNETNPDKPLPLRSDFSYSWETRTGHAIDGTPYNTEYHPYHDLKLYDTKKDTVYLVDGVYKHHEYGTVIKLLTRKEGTKSHGVVYWESISCGNPDIIKKIKDNHKRYKILES